MATGLKSGDSSSQHLRVIFPRLILIYCISSFQRGFVNHLQEGSPLGQGASKAWSHLGKSEFVLIESIKTLSGLAIKNM